MTTETRIYLIRHAHADWRQDEERPLSRSGVAAAALLADRLGSRPIAAVYSSPSRRALETVEPLVRCLGLCTLTVPELRERELPPVPDDEFAALVRDAWMAPEEAPPGGESNVVAQARGLAVVQSVVARHTGSQVVLSTHGNLLALVVSGLDSRFGYEFWRELSFPDVYQLTFDGSIFHGVERLWHAA